MIKKYPFQHQSGIKDCGPACLLMIIKYYGGSFNLSKLGEMTKTSKRGTNAYNLIETAKELGFIAKGIKTDLKEENIILPCIAHVIMNNYHHYIVIYQINYMHKYLIVADPANKIIKITFDEFNKIWDNILIMLYPMKPIPKMNQDIPLRKFVINLITPYKTYFINIIFLSILVTILAIFNSYGFKYLIDADSDSYLYLIFAVFLISNLLKAISEYLRNKVLIFLNQKLDYTLTTSTVSKIISLPYHYYRNHTTGEITSRITDISYIRDMVSNIAISLFVDLPLTIIVGCFLYFISRSLFFIAMIILGLSILILIIYKSIISDSLEEAHDTRATTTSYLIETITGFETIKGLKLETNQNNTFKSKYINLLNKIFKLDTIYNSQFLFKEIVNSVGSLVILFVGVLLVLEGKLTIGTLISFQALLTYFLEPIQNIIAMNYKIKEAKITLNRLLDITNYEIISKNNLTMVGDIKINHLTYSYNNVQNVIDDLSLTFKSKSKNLILGKSGSGKSTILKVIMKYYKVPRNKVLINEIDINDLSVANIAYISQNEILFTDTVRNNLKLNRDISEEKMFETAKLCEVESIFKNSQLGYDQVIEENGFNISGGEKQRIILARTLLNNFDYLLIDEGLSEVDISLERLILKRIFERFKDKTIIVVSHRLENMDLFDNVLKLDGDSVV